MSSSADKVSPASLFAAEESSKYTSSKYVVDGFEVPATENTRDDDGNLYAESKHDASHKQQLYLAPPEDKQQQKQQQQNRPSGGSSRGNSTFREVSNLTGNAASASSTVAASTSSLEKTDKNAFQKRNDYDPYWAIGYSSNQQNSHNNHNNPFMIEPVEQQPKSYIRHRPQSEPSGLLIATNLNPYLNNKQQPNSQSESYYVYDSSPPESSSSPYRSRYQHRYHHNPHNQHQNSRRPEPDLGSLQLTAAFSPQSRPPPQQQSSVNDGTSLLLGTLRTASPSLLSEQQSIKPGECLCGYSAIIVQ